MGQTISCCPFNLNQRPQLCDSMYGSLNDLLIKLLKRLYTSHLGKGRKLPLTIISVENQNNFSCCKLFAVAFAADILSGDVSVSLKFDASQTWNH